MSIRDWPVNERPREKLLEVGAATLSEAELLAILIRNGRRGASALDLARELLNDFGSLRGLLCADRESFCSRPGLGAACYAELQAAMELARRHHRETLQARPGIANARSAHEYLVSRLRDRPYEVFCCIYLDSRRRMIAFDELFRGTVDTTSVHPREVVRQALARNAAAVIAVHNHPSGVAEPSRLDEMITRRLKEALGLLEIELVDHLIVGDDQCVSMSECGLL